MLHVHDTLLVNMGCQPRNKGRTMAWLDVSSLSASSPTDCADTPGDGSGAYPATVLAILTRPDAPPAMDCEDTPGDGSGVPYGWGMLTKPGAPPAMDCEDTPGDGSGAYGVAILTVSDVPLSMLCI